ncbi:ubiquitin conjugation factor E4 A isoform X2 [Teleopsis dalmanni]|uniref:ubiquitin conjugation factor E4 A isoform X2 n=1 Tax=Teleopsis dalmanni TaxID=139649 RepID=UPI0018CE0E7F|nr:ubiquitin conjugation factor E4 A isoform X2 [Teleopsis dalmanni]
MDLYEQTQQKIFFGTKLKTEGGNNVIIRIKTENPILLSNNGQIIMVDENPFAALIEAASPADGIKKTLTEEVFLFTLRRELTAADQRPLLSLASILTPDDGTDGTICEAILSHALFERLMMQDTNEYLLHLPTISSNNNQVKEATESCCMKYLYRAYCACKNAREKSDNKADCDKITNLILTNASTCMRQPVLFAGQIFSTQWYDILMSSDVLDETLHEFLMKIVQRVLNDVDNLEAMGTFKAMFYPLLSELQKKIAVSNLITFDKNIFVALQYFVREKNAPHLAETILDFTTPNPNAKGIDYADTLFGQLFSISIMPKNSNGSYEFFGDNSLDANTTDASLWELMCRHQNSVFVILKQLILVSPDIKKKVLVWFSNCLHANAGRGHIWSNINLNFDQFAQQNASDSFMTGLTAVLLRLCLPLCPPTLKVLIVDPTYCAVAEKELQNKNINMLKMYDETCLLPVEENEQRVTADKYNFVTELFYITHKAFELSYRACGERFLRMTRELHTLQTAFQDVITTDPDSDMSRNLLRMLQDQLQQYRCMRNGLTEPENETLILKFLEATAIWFVEISLINKNEHEALLAKKEFSPVNTKNRDVPTTIDFVPPYLKCIPENVLDNIVSYLNFTRHLPITCIFKMSVSGHYAFFKLIVLFMGNSELVKNPHLRAKLAEGLECLLPRKSTDNSDAFTTNIFDHHQDHLKLVRSLLNVFVSIEMTGQSVQFEQKFNYRRPMYAIMEFLWTKPDHVQCFKDLATEAEENMENIEPPLFLRFINLLINDAIFLLDESLSNLQQIRQLQEMQDSSEWNALSQNDRQQHLSNMHHLGMLARFDNILGRDTINILKLLTTEIKSIFCHNSLVDRIASMLNYFLLNLVGPNKEKFKVKDKKEFEFSPAETVIEICHIYINLSESDRFCLAISQDGRSYSSQLFSYAENILIRIRGGLLIGEMGVFADKVSKIEQQYKQEQEFFADAPDEYLDPIMSTLMTDPVTLPSSKVTVDRSTIARHLLSDQTDPFNRAPLTMDKVKSNTALKEEIEKWMGAKRSQSTNNTNS